MHYKQLLPTLLLGLTLIFNCGCGAAILLGAGAAGGGGTIAYLKGELKSTEAVSLNQAWEATQKAMNDLEFKTVAKAKDFFNAELQATSASEKQIKVALAWISDTSTEIKIRVGSFGDKSLSQQILQTIRKRL